MIIRLFKEINSVVESCGGVALELPTTEEDIIENISTFFQLVARYKVSMLLFVLSYQSSLFSHTHQY
jgi:hypothetical protein